MPQYLKITILCIALFILVLIAIISISITIKNHKLKNMYLKIETFFKNYVKANEGSTFEKSTEAEYDYKLKTKNNNYYFKVIPNFSGEEITINNSVKWQLRKSFNDETMRFVPDVEGFMRYEIEDEYIESKKEIKDEKEFTFSDLGLDQTEKEKTKKKKNIKIYIIYPNARLLLMYINECEMKFINPNTDVYGTNVIAFMELEKNRDSLIK